MSGMEEADAGVEPREFGAVPSGDIKQGNDKPDAKVERILPMLASDEDAYRMDYPHRGLALIINNRDFDARTHMNTRTGTDVDAANLYQLFKTMGFDVHMFHNQSCTNMLRLMNEASSQNHAECSSFVAALLSHGDEGIIYGTDGIIQLDTLTAPFKGDRCPTLAGKPKIFVIQACRGNKLDHGVEVADSDSSDSVNIRRLPTEADFLMLYSTVPGYFSWRNSTKGSWFVQAFCQEMDKHWLDKDLLSIMTRVSRKVAFDFQSNAAREEMNQKKQIPCVMSMLTKDVRFKR